MNFLELIKKFNMVLVLLLMLAAVGLLIYIVITVPKQCDFAMRSPIQYYQQETGESCTCQVKIPIEYDYPSYDDYDNMFKSAFNNSGS